eukprot:c20636_g6_i1.p2 GENE.c20636_g6_i1~~c20636_g6_i1.p2  ORF type:complete len:224 (-),score=24.66 c20636_g6_i1:473-1144(-)
MVFSDGKEKPDGTLAVAEGHDTLNFVGFLELKEGTCDLTAPADLAQTAMPLYLLMDARQERTLAFSLLANFEHVRLVRAQRDSPGGAVKITFGALESRDGGSGVSRYREAFQNFLLADLSGALGFSEAPPPAGWRRGEALGSGSYGRVVAFHAVSGGVVLDGAIVKKVAVKTVGSAELAARAAADGGSSRKHGPRLGVCLQDRGHRWSLTCLVRDDARGRQSY